jgi:hypothetical protein
MRRFLVSSFAADVTQQIHSLRASGVMSAHTSFTTGSESIALRKSAGNRCTATEAVPIFPMLISRLDLGWRAGIPIGQRLFF